MKNKRLQHSLYVKRVIKRMLKETQGIIYVNLHKNPHLKEWVKKHPRLRAMKRKGE